MGSTTGRKNQLTSHKSTATSTAKAGDKLVLETGRLNYLW